MTQQLYLGDSYLRDAPGTVTAHTEEGGIVLSETVFYPTGGGQPGDSGRIMWDDRHLPIATAVKGQGTDIVLVPSEPQRLPPIGTQIHQQIDWDRRHKHMRVHTGLHLLSVVIPFGVTGGNISAGRGRLDFDMPDAPEDKQALEDALNRFVEADLPVSEGWITEAELAAAPDLVKTMAVQPPRGQGDIRLVRIGAEIDWVDLQPCGGTHVARTGEIGALRIGKIEKKGRMNRRVYLHLES